VPFPGRVTPLTAFAGGRRFGTRSRLCEERLLAFDNGRYDARHSSRQTSPLAPAFLASTPLTTPRNMAHAHAVPLTTAFPAYPPASNAP